MTDVRAAGADGRVADLSIEEAVERVFTAVGCDTRAANATEPRFVLVTGTPASGKTRLRHEKYRTGYVAVDAGDIFRLIPNCETLDFPGEHAWFIDAVGGRVARRALAERRDVVTEVFATDNNEPLIEVIESMKALGYHTELVGIRADLERSIEWNEARGLSNVSSYFTNPFNVRWLKEAARAEAGLSSAKLQESDDHE